MKHETISHHHDGNDSCLVVGSQISFAPIHRQFILIEASHICLYSYSLSSSTRVECAFLLVIVFFFVMRYASFAAPSHLLVAVSDDIPSNRYAYAHTYIACGTVALIVSQLIDSCCLLDGAWQEHFAGYKPTPFMTIS